MLYNKVLGGLEDEIVILKVEKDNNLWYNTEVLYSIILGNPHQNIGEKEPIINYLVPNNY